MATAEDARGLPRLGSRWWVLVLIGVVSIIAGVLALAYPGLTLLLLGVILGANLFVWGTMTIVMAFAPRETVAGVVLRVLVGILATIAGLVCLVQPGRGALAIVLAVSFWFIVAGIADIAEGVHEAQNRVLSIVLGMIAILVGVFILREPAIGFQTVALLAGIGFLARGILEVIAGFSLRSATRA